MEVDLTTDATRGALPAGAMDVDVIPPPAPLQDDDLALPVVRTQRAQLDRDNVPSGLGLPGTETVSETVRRVLSQLVYPDADPQLLDTLRAIYFSVCGDLNITNLFLVRKCRIFATRRQEGTRAGCRLWVEYWNVYRKTICARTIWIEYDCTMMPHLAPTVLCLLNVWGWDTHRRALDLLERAYRGCTAWFAVYHGRQEQWTLSYAGVSPFISNAYGGELQVFIRKLKGDTESLHAQLAQYSS